MFSTSFITVTASLFWCSCALEDLHKTASIAVHQSGHLIGAKSTAREPEQLRRAGEPDHVDEIIKKVSGQAMKVFGHQKVADALMQLSSAYGGQADNAYTRVDRAKLTEDVQEKGHMDSAAMIYGEVMPEAVLHMLALGVQANPNLKDSEGKLKPGNWVDLGSGFGKTVVLASLLGFEGDGIELGSPRFNMACDSLDRLNGINTSKRSESECGSDEKGKAKFSLKSFADDSADLSNADLVFTDSVYWTDPIMAKLGEKASKMKKGSVVFSYKPFPSPAGEPPRFKSLGQVNLPVSWIPEGTFFHVQQVV